MRSVVRVHEGPPVHELLGVLDDESDPPSDAEETYDHVEALICRSKGGQQEGQGIRACLCNGNLEL